MECLNGQGHIRSTHNIPPERKGTDLKDLRTYGSAAKFCYFCPDPQYLS